MGKITGQTVGASSVESREQPDEARVLRGRPQGTPTPLPQPHERRDRDHAGLQPGELEQEDLLQREQEARFQQAEARELAQEGTRVVAFEEGDAARGVDDEEDLRQKEQGNPPPGSPQSREGGAEARPHEEDPVRQDGEGIEEYPRLFRERQQDSRGDDPSGAIVQQEAEEDHLGIGDADIGTERRRVGDDHGLRRIEQRRQDARQRRCVRQQLLADRAECDDGQEAPGQHDPVQPRQGSREEVLGDREDAHEQKRRMLEAEEVLETERRVGRVRHAVEVPPSVPEQGKGEVWQQQHEEEPDAG